MGRGHCGTKVGAGSGIYQNYVGGLTYVGFLHLSLDVGHDALRAKRKIAYGFRIAASPLADLEDLIRLGWPSRYFIQITILFTVLPPIFVLDGQESEKRRGRGLRPLPRRGG
jgi:hypothetical protein